MHSFIKGNPVFLSKHKLYIPVSIYYLLYDIGNQLGNIGQLDLQTFYLVFVFETFPLVWLIWPFTGRVSGCSKVLKTLRLL